jgi:acetyl/propionyl-CoA carboxylase alpha subunit
MKLHVAINHSQTDIQLRDEGSRVFAEIGDRNYEFQVEESAPGSYLMIHNNRVFDCRVEGRLKSGKPIAVVLGQTEYRVTLTDPRRLRGTTGVAASGDDVARIIAPMPGKVARVLVAVGDLVSVGDGLVVVEAMKMQNEMKSPKAGTVTSLSAEAGATVNEGDVLAVIE